MSPSKIHRFSGSNNNTHTRSYGIPWVPYYKQCDSTECMLLQTNGRIPTDGSGGVFGYGIVTSQGIAAVIVAASHQGVQDSVTRGAGSGPIWHNHFVQL